MLQIIRQIQQDIQGVHRRERGRFLVLTGARQVGKSTLASMAFPDYPVINLDSPVERAAYEQLGPEEWVARYPCAIVDEAQKLPAVIETLKACYDRDAGVRYILLGSSQILLLEKVRESLAGRAALRALFPFTLPELLAAPGESRLVEILSADDPVRALDQLCPATYRITAAYAQAKTRWEYFLHWGGMPRLREWDDEDRFAWLLGLPSDVPPARLGRFGSVAAAGAFCPRPASGGSTFGAGDQFLGSGAAERCVSGNSTAVYALLGTELPDYSVTGLVSQCGKTPEQAKQAALCRSGDPRGYSAKARGD